MSKKCPNCGACPECGARTPYINPYPVTTRWSGTGNLVAWPTTTYTGMSTTYPLKPSV